MNYVWRFLVFVWEYVVKGIRDYTVKKEEASGGTIDEMTEASAPEFLEPPVEEPKPPPLPEPGDKPVPIPSPPSAEELEIEELNRRMETMRRVVIEEFDPPFPPDKMPKKISELRPMYGRAPKEKGYKKYKKAELKTFRFPGSWNGYKKNPKLYVHVLFEPFLRFVLKLCAMLGILEHVKSIGSYNHRHIRHSSANPLSNHAWAIATDLNTSSKYCKRNLNRAIYRAKHWWRKITKYDVKAGKAKKKDIGKPIQCEMENQYSYKGPVPMPFTKDWLAVYKDGMPFEMVMAFKAVGLGWGGDWGLDEWIPFVLDCGVGYDPSKLEGAHRENYKKALKQWEKVRYCDPMHWEAQARGGGFMKEWMEEGREELEGAA